MGILIGEYMILPNTKHSIYELPDELNLKLINLVKSFGLDYACLDLCMDQYNEFWVLDVNPFGKYMWIELSIGLEISKGIAKFLKHRISNE